MVFTALSSSVDVDTPTAVRQIVVTGNCADTNAALMSFGFHLQRVCSGPVGEDFETAHLYERKYPGCRR